MADNEMQRKFTRIPNDVLDSLIGSPLGSTEWAIVALVVRNTYGWNRKAAPYTWAGIGRALGCDQRNVRRVGVGLIKAGVLVVDSGGNIGLQEDPLKWGRLAPLDTSDSPYSTSDSPGRVRRSGRARSPVYEGESARLVGRVGRTSTVEPKDSKDIKKKKDSRTAPTDLIERLPNGKPDSAYERGQLGNFNFLPEGAPDWGRTNYEVQQRCLDQYRFAVAMQEDAERQKRTKDLLALYAKQRAASAKARAAEQAEA